MAVRPGALFILVKGVERSEQITQDGMNQPTDNAMGRKIHPWLQIFLILGSSRTGTVQNYPFSFVQGLIHDDN